MPWYRNFPTLRLNSKACYRQRFYSLSTVYQTSRPSTDQPYQVCRDTLALLEAGRENDDRPRSIEITAHVRSIRQQKKRAFVTLGDGSSSQSIQALLAPSDTTGLSTGAAVKIRGQWQKCPPSKEQSHELVAEEVEVLGQSDPETFPIRKHYLTPEYLRTLPHLRVRTPTNALIARTRSETEYHVSTYFRNEGFIRLQPPVITSSDCEGAGEVFTVSPRKDITNKSLTESGAISDGKDVKSEDEFFRGQKYLTVSNQLHLEAFVHEHQRVWALAPTFRAEHSDTPRHLSEFYMLEAELRCETLDQVMDVVEGMIRYLVQRLRHSNISCELLDKVTKGLLQGAQPQENTLSRRWDGLYHKYWPRINYTTAIQHLKQAAHDDSNLFEFNPDWETGLHLEHEKYIASTIGKGSPVFVTHYPQHNKPFYMLPTSRTLQSIPMKKSSLVAEPDTFRWKSHQLPFKLTREEELEKAHPTVACFDLLLPDLGELVGGSLREHRFEELASRMSKDKLAGLDWYLELRKFGSVPHGGFGLGYDRLLMYLSGAESVRDIVQWPRYYGRCDA